LYRASLAIARCRGAERARHRRLTPSARSLPRRATPR
jgi:hypothetical protein